jgi:hypothetical protein
MSQFKNGAGLAGKHAGGGFWSAESGRYSGKAAGSGDGPVEIVAAALT